MSAGVSDAPSGLDRVRQALADRQPSRMVPDLDRITDLVDLLGSPQRAYPSIHITGTNGKTSTARITDSLLRAFGLRVGRYTSPHLESVTERICVDGRPLPDTDFARAYDDVSAAVDLVDARHPDRVTYFELLTAMAFAAFADAPVDAAVVEVGMGGTWDATNVVHAPVAVVTPIALDHPELGDAVQAVAGEKAGIIHEGAVLVTAIQPVEAATVLLRRSVEVGATVAREGLEFGVVSRSVAVGGQQLSLQGLGGRYEDLFLPLHGAHQASNAAYALAAVEAFFGAGSPLELDAVREGFAAADSPGRLEVIRTGPTVVLDGAHNPAGAVALVEALAEAFRFDRVVAVVGVLADKDVRGILEALEPGVDVVVATTSSSPRAMSVDALAALAVEILGESRVEVAVRLDDALDAAIRIAEEEAGDGPGFGSAGVVVTGSVVTVGEARTLLRR